jgi:hypothetical protein
VYNATLNGRSIAISFTFAGTSKTTFKIPKISLTGSEADGALVSFSLRKDALCPTLDSFLKRVSLVACHLLSL